MNRKRIIIGVDNTGWCWTTTAVNLIKHLPEYEFIIMKATEFKSKAKRGGFDADMIFLRGYSHMFLTEQQAENLDIPFISSLATGGENIMTRIGEMRETAMHAHGIYVQNSHAEYYLKRDGWKNIFLIPNGIDTGKFYPGPRNPVEYAGLAGNTKGKRGTLKGKCFATIALESRGIAYIEANHGENKIRHEYMPDWYRTLRYYLQPSRAEGCSNSVMEAMASGIPSFICEGVGYHGEVCKCGIKYDDGQVVFVERNENDIAEKLTILKNNPYIYRRIRKNAIEFARAHNWGYIAGRFKEMFEHTLNFSNRRIKKDEEVKELKLVCGLCQSDLGGKLFVETSDGLFCNYLCANMFAEKNH